MSRYPRGRFRRGWIVVILVSLVVAYCILNTLQTRYDMNIGLPEFRSGALEGLADFLDGLLEGDTTPKEGMDNALEVFSHKETLRVHFLDVGQAKAILIQAPGQTVLIDGGDNATGKDVVRYLREAGAETIDLVIITHPHSDHIGGLDRVIEDLTVKTVVMTDLPEELVPTSATYTGLLLAIAREGVKVEEYSRGKGYDLGDGAKLTLLAPASDYADLNEMSIVSRLDYGENSFLFTGDAGKPSELDMLDGGIRLSADVLDIGHHGSRTSTSMDFLKKISPSIAVISCGLDNSYGHPHLEALERLDVMGATVYRTDLQGAVVVESDGSQLSVSLAA